MLNIEDPALPGLARLSQQHLCDITGAEQVDLLRLRYRAGKRAILHLATRSGAGRSEATLWFFKGDKARRLARRNKRTARFDARTSALLEAFPNDHRMPQIAAFMADPEPVITAMTGMDLERAPDLLRYRPGLSCTFRCAIRGAQPVYVKLINDDDPVRLFEANKILRAHFAGGAVTVAPALGRAPAVSALAYASASGVALDIALAQAGSLAPLGRALEALERFWQAPVAPTRLMDPEMLLTRARESAAFVAVTAPACRQAAEAVVARLAATRPDAALRPIHGDMKLEHLFLDEAQATFIDTESVSLGLPDYDLAQLYGRLQQAAFEGQLPGALVQAACARVADSAGPAFAWCQGVVALRLAKFYAQRPAPGTDAAISKMLDRLA